VQNPGIQKALAKHLGFTREHIRGVLYSKYYSRNGLVEGLLADLGAPGMRERQKEAEIKSRGKLWTDEEKKRLTDKLKKLRAGRRAA
jgi:hypothetical protein